MAKAFRVLERLYVKSKEDPTMTLSFANKILHEGSQFPSWYPSNKLTPEDAAWVIANKDKCYFNLYSVPESEQLVSSEQGSAKTARGPGFGSSKKAEPKSLESAFASAPAAPKAA